MVAYAERSWRLADALSWFVELSPREQAIVQWRALLPPYSFLQIGDRLKPKISDSEARKEFESALHDATRIANGRRIA